MLINDIFKKRRRMSTTKVYEKPKIGLVNGLWANDMGVGGLIPIEVFSIPTNISLFKFICYKIDKYTYEYLYILINTLIVIDFYCKFAYNPYKTYKTTDRPTDRPPNPLGPFVRWQCR